MDNGSTVNVLLEFETEGDDEVIWTQELKLSEETWKVPEQEVLDILVVTEVVSIDTEKVAVMLSFTDTDW